MLAPGSGKTKTGRLWTYVRDEQPWGGGAHPAVLFRYVTRKSALAFAKRVPGRS